MIQLFKVFMADEVGPAINTVLYSGYIAQGPKVDEFEAKLEAWLDVENLLALNSGTSSLQLACKLAGVKPGTKVISTPMTCLAYNSLVHMADGTKIKIGKLVKQKSTKKVLSFNSTTGLMEFKRISGWVKLPSKNVTWFKLIGLGRGKNNTGNNKGILITGDHKVLTTSGYVRVDSLNTQDQIVSSEPAANPKQIELITGTMLGDANIARGGIKNLRGRLAFAHALTQSEWFHLKVSALKGYNIRIKHKEAYKQSKPSYYMQTRSTKEWQDYAIKWYNGRIKKLPDDLQLTPLAIATWYMDDGSKFNTHGALFCTDAFTPNEVDRLCLLLAEYQIIGKRGYRNRIYIQDATKLFEMIAPYVPLTMRYKLIGDSLPKFNIKLWNLGEAVRGTYTCEVLAISKPAIYELTKYCYCIEVEDNHNFIVGNLVVKNCTATNTAIRAVGGDIEWADINPVSGNIDPESVSKILSGWNFVDPPVAIMAVDWAGNPCDWSELRSIADRHGVKLIEDAAHAFGAKYKGQYLGRIADYTCYSFQAIKHLTSIDGGALICKDKADYERGKLLRWFGIDRNQPRGDFRCEADVIEAGFKYHMNDVNATVGICNLAHMNTIVGKHKENAAWLNASLNMDHVGGNVVLPLQETDKDSAYWIYTVKVPNRVQFMNHMLKYGITVSQVHARNDLHTMFKQYAKYLPGVDEFSLKQCSIPVGWWLTAEERTHIVNTIHTPMEE